MTGRTYTNPLWPRYFADPFVLAAQGRYYAFGTGEGEAHQDLVGLVSDDLVSWEALGTVLQPDAIPDDSTHLWAPEIARIGDEYVLFYSAGVHDKGHRLRAASSRAPQGPYRDLGARLAPDEPFAIDPHPFRDDDGTWYLFYAVDRLDAERVGTSIVVDRMLAPDRLAGDPRPVVVPSADWQLFLAGREMYDAVYDWHTCEGAFVVKRGGRYWCLYSGGNWQQPSYGVSAASADHPLGPWREEPGEQATVIRTRQGEVHGPGHASVVTDAEGEDWLVYHAWDPEGTARRMCVDRLRWTDDGPVCDGPTTTPQPAPAAGPPAAGDHEGSGS
jgi:arabinan endo-1,5-alpha-L-arabinosidase